MKIFRLFFFFELAHCNGIIIITILFCSFIILNDAHVIYKRAFLDYGAKLPCIVTIFFVYVSCQSSTMKIAIDNGFFCGVGLGEKRRKEKPAKTYRMLNIRWYC